MQVAAANYLLPRQMLDEVGPLLHGGADLIGHLGVVVVTAGDTFTDVAQNDFDDDGVRALVATLCCAGPPEVVSGHIFHAAMRPQPAHRH